MFLRIKNIKNKKNENYAYYYLCKSYWDKEKKSSRQKVVKYIGKVKGMCKYNKTKVFEKNNYKCKKFGSKKNLTVDHVKPLSKGGSNNLENLQTLCLKCNLKKRNLVI